MLGVLNLVPHLVLTAGHFIIPLLQMKALRLREAKNLE